jgi:hypothetical protein
MENGVQVVEEIPHRHVACAHPRRACPELDRADGVGRKGNCPEQTPRIGVDPGVEVVDLGGEVVEVKLTSVEVKSN